MCTIMGIYCRFQFNLSCADLNSMPDSGVVKFLREGSIAPHHDELLDIDYTRTLARLSFPSGKMANGQSPKKSLAPPWTASLGGNVEHPLKVRDVYRHAGSPLSFTNYTFDFQGVIDYILVRISCKQSVRPLWPGHMVACFWEGVQAQLDKPLFA